MMNDQHSSVIDEEMIMKIVHYANLYIENGKNDMACTSMQDTKEIWYFIFYWHKQGHHTNVIELWNVYGSGMMIVRAAMCYERLFFYFVKSDLMTNPQDVKDI